MSNDIQAIETTYRGVRFRSRLEARWAVFFTECGLEWQYEPEGFVIDGNELYLPDLYIPSESLLIEIKPVFDKEALRDATMLHRIAKHMNAENCWLIVGTPGINTYVVFIIDEFSLAEMNDVVNTAVDDQYICSLLRLRSQASTMSQMDTWHYDYIAPCRRSNGLSVMHMPAWPTIKLNSHGLACIHTEPLVTIEYTDDGNLDWTYRDGSSAGYPDACSWACLSGHPDNCSERDPDLGEYQKCIEKASAYPRYSDQPNVVTTRKFALRHRSWQPMTITKIEPFEPYDSNPEDTYYTDGARDAHEVALVKTQLEAHTLEQAGMPCFVVDDGYKIPLWLIKHLNAGITHGKTTVWIATDSGTSETDFKTNETIQALFLCNVYELKLSDMQHRATCSQVPVE